MSWHERPYSDGEYSGRSAFADNPLTWAPTLCRVFGIRIRIHMLFILYVLFQLLTAGASVTFVAQYLTVLFGSVFLHELGHCFAARRVGGTADEVLMWPLGGLAMVDAPRAPWPQFFTVVCGPLVTVALAVFGVLTMQVFQRGIEFNPFLGWGTGGSTWTNPYMWATLLFKINWVLFLFNLWPMYPMDGGRMVHCGLWWKFGFGKATSIATSIGMVAAVLLGFYGLVNGQFMLIAIAFMGYTTCYQERLLLKAGVLMGAEPFGGGYTAGYADTGSSTKGKRGWFARWKERSIEKRRQRMQRDVVAEQQTVDQILDKVRDRGIQSLTSREKSILEEATKRQQTGRR